MLAIAGLVMVGPLQVSAAPSYVTTQGPRLMYLGQPIVLRGVNFNNEPALSCCGGPDINSINAVQSDYAQAHQLGVNHLRWGIDYYWYASNRTQFFNVLDQHMAWAAQYQLWVYLNAFIPPGGSSGGFDQSAGNGYCIWSDCAAAPANQTLLNNMWQDIATHYANNPTIVGYDPLNEPAPPADSQWAALATRLYNTITAADPNHLVIIEAPLSNDLSLFSQTSRVIYSVHHYPGGDNFPTGTPANTPMIVGEFGDQRINSGAVSFVAGEVNRYNAAGVSWTFFVWREDVEGFGLYVDPAGDFSSPWTPMINTVQAAWAGNVMPAAIGGPSPSPSPSPSPTPTPPPSSGIPNYDHIVQIVMENTSYSEMIGSSSAPYINQLAGQGALATNYVNTTHPSLPAYMELTAGQIGSCTDDFLTNQCSMPGLGLADRIEASGRTWKGYMESMGTPCRLDPGGTYAAHHNPWIYFDNIRNNATRCNSHDVDYSQLATNLASASTTPNYAWITPNNCSNMHDCSISTGDTWLSQNIPPILASPAFTTQHSLLILTWDEGFANDQLVTIFVGYGVTPGRRSATSYDHYSLLKTIEASWGLATLTGNDAAASPMTDMFGGTGSSPLSVSSSASRSAATAPASITFTSTASGGTAPYSYAWTFGDGGSSTSQNPSHSYTSAGTYTVNLTVSDAAAHIAAASALTVTISPTLGVTDAASASVGNTPFAVNFTSTPTGGRTPYTYSWTFGDGGSATSQNPSHIYTAAGTFSANLTVTDANAATAVASSLIITVHGPLTAAASASPLAGDAPVTVAFTGSGSGGTPPYTYRWTFGDGTSSTSQNPSHAYSAAGTFTATLTVTDASAATATSTAVVVVSPTLLASTSANITVGAAPLAVNFTGAASGGRGPFTYAWTFGDGASSTSQNPSHTYAVAGTFSVNLAVTDANLVRANATPLTITITPSLSATSSVLPAAGDAPLAVNFTGTPAGGSSPYTFAWAFGDGGTSTSQNPSHSYATAGTYTATLTVTDAIGARATASPLTVTVNPLPTATAVANRNAGDAPVAISFTGSVTAGTAPFTYAWTFGDGTSSTTQNPSHTYTTAGIYTVTFTVTDAPAHSASASALTITISPTLSVTDAANATTGNAPLAVSFTGTSSGGRSPYSYAWTFGDGSSSTAQNPSHTYSSAGTYSANLTVTDANAATASASSLIITVHGPLSAAAMGAPLAGDAPVTVAFTGSGSGGTAPYGFRWAFGDGASSTLQNPSHIYSTAGTYSASVTVTDAVGATATATASVVVSPTLVASASASATNGAAPLLVNFTGAASGGLGPFTYAWTFGDSTSSTSQSPSHTYATAGSYTVNLSVTDANHVTAAATPLTITTFVPLSASSSSGPRAGDAPFSVSFSGSAVGGTAPYGYSWTFGDGATSTVENPSHTYTAAGSYAVNLTVSDATARTASATALTVTVSPTLSISDTASVNVGNAPLAVNFTSTPAGGLAPYSYLWTFGDGSSATGQNPSHSYAAAGTYSANLTLTDVNAATATATTLTITVHGPLSATASASPLAGDAPAPITFTGNPAGGTAPYTFAWTFGDGGTSTSQNPGHTYNSPGTYTASLTVTDSVGARVTASVLTITVNPLPLAAAAASRSAGDAPVAISFTGSVTGGTAPFTYAWTFGDESTSTSQNPSHTYTTAGTFTVNLTVTDAAAQSAPASPITITISPALSVSDGASVSSGNAPLAVTFASTPTGGLAPYSFAWTFGDGATSTDQNPSYTYAAGSYTVHLTVTDANGATATAAPLTIAALVPLSASSSSGPIAGNAPFGVAFNGAASGGTAPYAYAWTFGDGASSSSQNPSHTFTVAGTYSVILIVTDAAAHTASARVLTITVSPTLSASAGVDVSSGTAPLAVSFTSTPNGGLAPYTYAWTFGDGASSTGQNPGHTYPAGSYTANLTVTDANGATASASGLTVISIGPLSAGASATPTIGDAPVTTALNGSANGGRAPYAYSWDLGDGATSTAKSPSHVYSTAGTYTAALTVNDASGQVSHASAQITVYPALSVSTSATPASGVASLQVTFAASASGGLAPYSFAWVYGDGTTGSGATSVHAFSAGTFHPTLTVHDAAGGSWNGSAGTITVSSPVVTAPTPTPIVPPSPEGSPSPSVTPSPTAAPSVSPPPPPSVSPSAAQNPSGSQGAIIRLLLMLLGSLFVAGLGGTLFLTWLRHRG